MGRYVIPTLVNGPPNAEDLITRIVWLRTR